MNTKANIEYKNTSKSSSMLKKYTPWPSGSYLRYTTVVQHPKLKVKHHINKERKVIILIDTEKAYDKIWHPFMIKPLNKLGTEVNFLNLIKGNCENPTANIRNTEGIDTFPLRSGTRQRHQLSSFVFNIVQGVLVRATRQEKKK